MDTGKFNGFLKARILLASAGNQNVTVNRKTEFFCTSKQTDQKLIVSVSLEVSCWNLQKLWVAVDSSNSTML